MPTTFLFYSNELRNFSCLYALELRTNVASRVALHMLFKTVTNVNVLLKLERSGIPYLKISFYIYQKHKIIYNADNHSK